MAIEEKGGVLSLIKTSLRGAPIEEGKGESRRMRHFDTLRVARGKTLYASSVQNIRAFAPSASCRPCKTSWPTS